MNSGLLLMTFSMSCRLLVVCNLHVKLQISISFKSVFMMGELLELLFFFGYITQVQSERWRASGV